MGKREGERWNREKEAGEERLERELETRSSVWKKQLVTRVLGPLKEIGWLAMKMCQQSSASFR
jgi:hypothetical protein